VRRGDVPILCLLRSAAEQDHQRFAILAEVDAIPGPKSILHSKTPAPTSFTLEKFPSSSRRTAVVTLAAAAASSPSNHFANGLEPSRFRNSRAVIATVTHTLPLSKADVEVDACWGGEALGCVPSPRRAEPPGCAQMRLGHLYKIAVSDRRTLGDLSQFCDNAFATARKPLILNGEMLERSIRHAWKAIRATLTE
jgi:hypothetical protein